MNQPLAQKTCTACELGTPPLDQPQINKFLTEIKDWQANSNLSLKKEFIFDNFNLGLAFINKVGALAEAENHHPDICLHDYKKVTLTLSTHSSGGLSENDFILAAKIDLID